MKKNLQKLTVLFLALLLFSGCTATPTPESPAFSAGFASKALTLESLDTCYIAGYHNGKRPEGQLDDLCVSALWLEDGITSLLLFSIDCVGLGSDTVARIRAALEPFCKATGCNSVNVVSTHTHAGVDTLGLWGPVGLDGKNEAFLQQLVDACVVAAKAAYQDRAQGQLYYSVTETSGLQKDSRSPHVYDPSLYQFRFAPDVAGTGIRILSFAAHAESLRGGNRLISSDFPGQLRKNIAQETGDRVLFLPGAVGGLIMTPEFDETDALRNLEITGQKLTEYALHPSDERRLSPEIRISRQAFETPLENTLFLYYRFLGILGNETRRDLAGNYFLQTELTLLELGETTLALLPGEIFPELVSGTGKEDDPEALAALAERYGVEELVVLGLANDEIGYILPPSDYLLHGEAPYVLEAEDHYEETNSLGPDCAVDLTEAFEEALKNLQR